ncbi:HET domain-containing protein [Fusarium sp. LHS14.1]|nr:HET domain-containing protein [Fusarium sp. LHS14.1]
MRLLNTQTIVVETFGDDQIPSYAILSHTWEAEEVTFQDMELGKATSKKGWAKIKDSCSMARKNGFNYVWLDTCCIDKTSSAELSEAINSMYHWYQEAAVCYAFLADVSDISGLSGSKWFTRGWTLQELIAPSSIIFFSQTWDQLGTRETLDRVISKRTRIPRAILSGHDDLETASVAQRMSWASDRSTTRREDLAYCLMGIFSINMPLLYGEGERAFIRLQEEIMRVSDDHSLFAWKCADGRGGLLAPSPVAFKDSGNIIPRNLFMPYNSPFTLTNKGVHLDLPFIGLGDRGTGLAVLSCTQVGDPDKLVAIYLRDMFLTMEHFERCDCEKFQLISLSKFRPAEYPTRSLCIALRGPNQRLKGASNVKARTGPPPLSDEKSNDELDEQMQLFLAIAQGLESEVERLLTLPNVQADFENDEGRTPLSLAAEAGHEGIVRLLLNQRNVDINAGGKQGLSPITYATDRGHEGIVWQLLSRTDISSSPSELLSRAASYGHETLLSQLLARRDIRDHLTTENYASVFSDAAQHGHESVVRLLLGLGKVHPNQEDSLGNTALWWAAVNGHEAVVKMLLETGWADADCKGNDGATALWHAASKGNEGIVRLLLRKCTDIESPGNDGRSPLRVVSFTGHAPIAERLLAHGAESNPRSCYNRTALMEAMINGHEGVARLLIESGAAIDTNFRIESKPHNYYSAVDFACQANHAGTLKLLLELGAPSASRDADIRAAFPNAFEHRHTDIVRTLLEATEVKQSLLQPYHLVVAAINKDQAMVKVLLENGADVNSEWNGSLLFGFAFKQGCDEIVKAMLPGPCEQGWRADVESRVKELGLGYSVGRNKSDIPRHTIPLRRQVKWYMMSPLWCATVNGQEEMVQLLLEHGANPNNVVHTSGSPTRKSESSTALYEATRLCHENIVRLLLSSGADPNLNSDDDHSPLVQASLNTADRSVAMAQMLLAAGADVDVRAYRDETPLIFAVRSGNVDLAKLLLRHGADREARNIRGVSAMDFASNHASMDFLR